MSRTIRCRIAALALGSLLIAPWAASAAPRPALEPPGSHRTADDSAAGLVTRFWSALKAIWGDEGCTLDPNGAHCASNPHGGGTAAVAPAPEGCTLDPDGRCASSR